MGDTMNIRFRNNGAGSRKIVTESTACGIVVGWLTQTGTGWVISERLPDGSSRHIDKCRYLDSAKTAAEQIFAVRGFCTEGCGTQVVRGLLCAQCAERFDAV